MIKSSSLIILKLFVFVFVGVFTRISKSLNLFGLPSFFPVALVLSTCYRLLELYKNQGSIVALH